MRVKSGTGGASAAKARYYGAPTMPEGMADRAAYYLRGVARGDLLHTAAVPRENMSREVAAVLGLDPSRAATLEEVAHLIAGLRADGGALPGAQRNAAYEDRAHVTYYDVTLSAPRSVSIAFALAETDAERMVILRAHEEANTAAMDHLEDRIARVRRGHAGSQGSDPGQFGAVSFLHVSSRPTVWVPMRDPDGTPASVPMDVPDAGPGVVAGDMNLHTHNIVPNAVVLPDGAVGCLDTLGMHDFVHEAGGVYQFTLATRLRAQGVEYGIDPKTELGHIPSVPRDFVEHMSKRRRQGEGAAREYAASQGLDWDALTPQGKASLLDQGTQGKGQRLPKQGEAWAEEAWREDARAFGYEHRSVIDPARIGTQPLPREERHRVAHGVMLDLMEKRWDKRAVLPASEMRVATTRALIATGAEGPVDIEPVIRLAREHGVRHDGQRTELVVVELAPHAEGTLAECRGAVKLTTRAHLDQETEALSLIAEAAGDRSGALRPEQVDAAVERVAARDGLDFTSETGREQRRIIDAIAEGGRFVAIVGGPGAGKSTLLGPLIEAWQADGREVWGIANAWEHARKLRPAGIADERGVAMDKLLRGVTGGRIKLGPHSVVVVDEFGRVGTKDQRALSLLQREHGFSIVALGDDEQTSPVVHGNPYALIRRAIGAEGVAEITVNVRQRRQRDRETVALLRAGRGADAVERLRADDRAHLIPGGYEDVVRATATMWDENTRALADKPGTTVSISTPTNQEARDISAAIRELRRARPETDPQHLRPDAFTVQAQDQARDGMAAFYDLPLAVGDRVRLFDLVRAKMPGKPGAPIFGNNGTIVRIEAFTPDGFEAANPSGQRAAVKWDALRDRHSGRIRLTYGDAVSIDAIQSATDTVHLATYPAGTADVHSKKANVANSRAREETHVIVGDGVERQAIAERRPIGDARPVSADDVWANVAANFSRRVEKELALELLDRAHRFRVGTARDFAPSMRAGEERERAGRPPGTYAERRASERDENATAAVVETVAKAARARGEAVKRLTGPKRAEEQATRTERRSARPASQRPKGQRPTREKEPHRGAARRTAKTPATPSPPKRPVPEWQARADFAAAVERAGLQLERGESLHMDGRGHYTRVEGSTDRKSKRGFYRAHLDGWPAGTIINHRSGVRIDWRAPADGREMTETERAAEAARMAANRAQQATKDAAREREKAARRDEVAAVAAGLWAKAPPARGHPYLDRKGLAGIGLRVGRPGQTVEVESKDGATRRKSVAGHLMIPMLDETWRVQGVQTIAPDGTKMFTGGMAGGRKQGTFAVIGEMRPGETVAIVEGYATGESWYRATGITTVVAWDSGNLKPVAEAIRAMDPARPIVFAADNDHHLPLKAVPKQNEGRVKAEAASAAVGGVIVVPPALPDRIASAEHGTDWDDFRQRWGWTAARELAGERLREHGIALNAPVPIPETTRGTEGVPRQQQERTMSDTERGQRPARRGPENGREMTAPNGTQSPRRRVERPVADAGSAARDASRRAQEQARTAGQDRGHSR